MILVQSLIAAFKNYVNFSGRASRGNYWWYVLAYVIVTIVLIYLDKLLFGGGETTMDTTDGVSVSFSGGALTTIWLLANIIPAISIAVRRLHDTDRSGWMYLLIFVPIVQFYLIYLLVIKGTAGDNRFGADPLA